MFPGISSQMFHKEKLFEGHAAAVREAGFEAMEIYGFAPHFDCLDMAQAQAVRKWFASQGLAVSALHAPFYEHDRGAGERRWLSLASTNEKLRSRTLESIGRCVDAAQALGTTIIVVHFGADGDRNTHEVISCLFSSLVHIEEMTRGTGVRAAYENIATPISISGYMSHLLEKYEFRNVGVCLDLGHANINEEPVAAVERCGPLLLNVHASDNNGREDSHEFPFIGNIRWGAVCRALKAVNYGGSFTLETRFSGDPYIMLSHLRNAYDAVLRAADEETE